MRSHLSIISIGISKLYESCLSTFTGKAYHLNGFSSKMCYVY